MYLKKLIFKNKKDGSQREYLQIVKSCREGKKVQQKLVAHLGRVDTPTGLRAVEELALKLLDFVSRMRQKSQTTGGDSMT